MESLKNIGFIFFIFLYLVKQLELEQFLIVKENIRKSKKAF